jgi:uncharacterized phage protein gp47/JayE
VSTAVPNITYSDTGISLPLESAILSGVRSDIDTAAGRTLNPHPATPQGQLGASLTAIIADKNDFFAWLVNQVNPDYSDGFMQDAIGRIYYLDRIPATSTVVTCQCEGAEGTVIDTGKKAVDTSGNIYIALESATIPASGTVDVQFQNIVSGAIPCPAGSVTTIYQVTPGWDAVSNSSAGTTGRAVESRPDFEYRRFESVAVNSNGSLASIKANVMQVPGVLDCYAYENWTGEAITIGETSYSLSEHSIYVAVVGGDSDAIAQAIFQYKAPGANYNGDTTVTVYDTSYDYPYPEYAVVFQRPDPLPVKFAVRLVDNQKLPSDIVAQVKAAIVAAFSGADGGKRARIGSELVAGRFYAGVSAISPYVSILSILIGTSTATETSVTPGIDQYPTIDADDITVELV